MNIKKIKIWIENKLNLCARILGLIIGLFIVFSKSNQQIIGVITFVVAIVGINPIKEYVEIAIDKFRKSKKGNLFSGGYDHSDTQPKEAEVPEPFKNKDRSDNLVYFHRLVAAAMQYYNTNQFDLAAKCAEDALRINSDDINLRNWLSIIYGEKICNKVKAIHHTKKILEIEPKNISAKFNLAVYTNHLEGHKKSLPLYLDVEKTINETRGFEGSEILAKLNLFLGHDYRSNNNIDEAKKRYTKAKEIFQERIKAGEAIDVSNFWLKDANKHLSDLEKKNT